MKQFKQFFLSALALLAILFAGTSCMDDLADDIVVQPDGAKQIPYTVTVQQASETKVTVDDTDQQTLLFETGDQLFIEGPNISGTLTLVTGGEGSSSAFFSGVLTYTGFGDPDPDLDLTATLRSAGQPWPVDYSSAVAPTLADAVRDYSVFTGTGKFGAMNFSLSQQSAFIVFDITLAPAPADGDQAVTIYNNQGDETLAGGTVNVSGGKATFAVAFDGSNTTLIKPLLGINGYIAKFGGASSVALAAGGKYSVAKTASYSDRLAPLTIEAKENNTTVTVSNPNTLYILRIVYGNNPSARFSNEATFSVELNANERVEFFGANEAYAGMGGFTTISCDKDSYVYGNVMSLVQSEVTLDMTNPSNVTLEMTKPSKYAFLEELTDGGTFVGLFNNEHIINHPVRNVELPATVLTNYCYYGMFSGSGISRMPNLPATTGLANYCYESMFESCPNIVTVPENLLPSINLKKRCYANMFKNCVNLKNAPALPAMELQEECYSSMFSGCTILEEAPKLKATTLAPSCYSAMFTNCTSIVRSPDLPATTLASRCYNCMFIGCSSLNYIKCLATDITAEGCTTGWTNGVAASGTFVRNENMTDWTTGVDGIPVGWTVAILPVAEFSIGVDKKVAFSPGNLQYQASTGIWRFAENQFDFIGNGTTGNVPGSDNRQISPDYTGWIDLFGWGTVNNPTLATTELSDYYGSFTDWGTKAIGCYDANTWRTLSSSESSYLLNSRSDAANKVGFATVAGVKGIILLPDDFTDPHKNTSPEWTDNVDFDGAFVPKRYYGYGHNVYSSDDWLNYMQPAGAVFLPVAGKREGTAVNDLLAYGYYWTSTTGSDERFATNFAFSSAATQHNSTLRRYGFAVRLVRDVD